MLSGLAVARMMTITGSACHAQSIRTCAHLKSMVHHGADHSTVKLTLSASRQADATSEHLPPHTLCSMMFQART